MRGAHARLAVRALRRSGGGVAQRGAALGAHSHVHANPPDLVLLQRGDEGISVHQPAAAAVDQQAVRRHGLQPERARGVQGVIDDKSARVQRTPGAIHTALCSHRRVDHVEGGGQQRRVQGHHVAPLAQVLQAGVLGACSGCTQASTLVSACRALLSHGKPPLWHGASTTHRGPWPRRSRTRQKPGFCRQTAPAA